MAESELVRPFQGDWRSVGLPESVGTVGQDLFMVGPVDKNFYLRCALAVSGSAARRLWERPDDKAVTLLTGCMIDLSRPGGTRPGVYRKALEDTLAFLGLRLMAAGNNNNPAFLEAEATIVPGELESPVRTFFRTVSGRNRTAAGQVQHPQGVGYATVRRFNQERGFLLGFCNPCANPDGSPGGLGGMRSGMWVDVDAIRQAHPTLSVASAA